MQQGLIVLLFVARSCSVNTDVVHVHLNNIPGNQNVHIDQNGLRKGGSKNNRMKQNEQFMGFGECPRCEDCHSERSCRGKPYCRWEQYLWPGGWRCVGQGTNTHGNCYYSNRCEDCSQFECPNKVKCQWNQWEQTCRSRYTPGPPPPGPPPPYPPPPYPPPYGSSCHYTRRCEDCTQWDCQSMGVCHWNPFQHTCQSTGWDFLHKADGLSFYKMPVRYGTKMVEGSVPTTCEMFGMRAACFGPSGCHYNSDRCRETSLPTECTGGPLHALAAAICSGQSWSNCPKLTNMFIYMNNWSGNAECGNVDGIYCTTGGNYVSTREKPYYAFCVQQDWY